MIHGGAGPVGDVAAATGEVAAAGEVHDEEEEEEQKQEDKEQEVDSQVCQGIHYVFGRQVYMNLTNMKKCITDSYIFLSE